MQGNINIGPILTLSDIVIQSEATSGLFRIMYSIETVMYRIISSSLCYCSQTPRS